MYDHKIRLTPWQLATAAGLLIVHTAILGGYIHAQFNERVQAEVRLSERLTRVETGSIYVEKTVARIDQAVNDLSKSFAEYARRTAPVQK